MLKFFSKKADVPSGPVEFLIVGLGNPGREYENTRHNAGFMAVDRIAGELGVKIDRLKFKSLCGDGILAGHRVLLMKPSTFMNLSGQAVQEAASFYRIPMERVLVFMDDISLEPGHVRIRRKGTDGGHNGLKNIIAHLGHDTFQRIKMGVGEKPKGYDLADYVLGHFDKSDRELMEQAAKEAADAVRMILTEGADAAMNRYNRKVKSEDESSQKGMPTDGRM